MCKFNLVTAMNCPWKSEEYTSEGPQSSQSIGIVEFTLEDSNLSHQMWNKVNPFLIAILDGPGMV
jgi:hypothetical protein